MIIQLKGKVKFPLSLDPSVWIFDDRKIIFEEAFEDRPKNDKTEKNELEKAAELFNQEIYSQKHIKPPVNKSINRFEREKILSNSYVMPIEDFIKIAEIEDEASRAILKTESDDIIITTEQLESAYFHFAIEGKQIKEDGPVHLYFGDGSNKDNPIRGFKSIIIE